MESEKIIIEKGSIITIKDDKLSMDWLEWSLDSSIPDGNYKVVMVSFCGYCTYHCSNGSSGASPSTHVKITNLKTKKEYDFTIAKATGGHSDLVFEKK